MTAQALPTATVPSPQCPRCGMTLPPVTRGTHVLRCGGCGAALEVRVRPVEPASTPSTSAPPAASTGEARPRRRPMVEVPGPRRAEVESPPTITVEFPFEPPSPTPAPPPPLDVPWYAEDIERLPEAGVDLGQLELESFEPHPPLPVSSRWGR